ncbi:hypothetical protein MUK42_05142 [Musa troglodytarum]|nr:hypothetical protein MUK42_05142 [Musa troglodytarum]
MCNLEFMRLRPFFSHQFTPLPPSSRGSLLTMKLALPYGGRRSGRNPVFVFVFLFSVLLFAMLKYNEHVGSMAEYSFGGAAAKSQRVARQKLHVVRLSRVGGAEEEQTVSERTASESAAKAARVPSVGSPVHEQAKPQRAVLDVPESCNLFDGRWVYDDVSYPIYEEQECAFLTEQVTCMRNGRRDGRYQRWRWLPRECNLPRFDAKVMLERLRGKRLMFVGDSLNRNQWESMVCLVQSAIPWGKKTLTKNASLSVFRAEEYDATVEFYWAPFLVESNSDDPKAHSIRNRVITNSIAKHGEHWKGVDYLIFNTYIWWMNTPEMRVLRGTEYSMVDRPVAYRRVLRTWARWVHRNVDPEKTTVFFMSASPNHMR